MKIVKKILTVVGIGFLSVSLCACTPGKSKTNGINLSADHEGETIQAGPDLTGMDFSDVRIGISLANCTANTYHASYVQAINEYVSELDVDAAVFDAYGDPAQQAAQIKTLISMDVDLIILWPTNSDLAVNWVRSIQEAGIPVILANTNVAPEGETYAVGFVGPSCVDEGYYTGLRMLSDLEGRGNIVVINGQDNYQPVKERRKGLRDACIGTRVHVIEEYNNGDERSVARTYMEECLKNHPLGEIDAVFCYDDEAGLGVYDAMENMNRTGEIKIYIGASGNYDSIRYISEGHFSATAIQSPIVDARTTLGYALSYVKGEKLPDFYNYIQTPVITPDNIDSYNIVPWES